MTAETLKPFLSTTISTGEQQKKLHPSKYRWMWITYVVLFIAFVSTLAGLIIWNCERIDHLQRHVNHLEGQIAELNNNKVFKFLNSVEDFEANYDKSKPVEGMSSTGRLPNPNNVDDEDDFQTYISKVLDEQEMEGDSKSTDDDSELESLPFNHSDFSGDGPDDYYNQDEYFDYKDDEDDDDDDDDEENNYYEPEDTEMPSMKRKQRSIFSEHGVPVNEESYAAKKNKTAPSYDDWLRFFHNGKHPVNTMKYDWSKKTSQTDQPLPSAVSNEEHKIIHRQIKMHKDHKPIPASINPIEQDQHQMMARTPTTYHGKPHDENDGSMVLSRRSRVMITRNYKPPIKSIDSDPVTSREQVAAPTTKVHRRRKMRQMHRSLGRRPRIIAAQFHGNAKQFETGVHEHYEGNGRLRHHGGVFTSWTPVNWMYQLGTDKHFEMNDGNLTVKESGLYYLYAQIFYHDEHDVNGYVIEQNGHPIIQCTTMTHSINRITKANSCYTGGLFLIKENDKIRVSALGSHRYAILDHPKTFFGLIRFNELRHPGVTPQPDDSTE